MRNPNVPYTLFYFILSTVNINTEDINNATKVARHFTFQEIQIATNNFSKLVGEGGFGPVYKGILSNGLEVAVKILSSTSTQGPQEFLNEVIDFSTFIRDINFLLWMEIYENDPCTFIQVVRSNVNQSSE